MLRVLEVGIGFALVFTLVALICSVINEWISAIVEKRGRMLWEGIANLIGTLTGDVAGHQLMQGLVREPTWFDRLVHWRPFRGKPVIARPKPSYVPPDIFVTTLLDVLGNKSVLKKMPTTFAELEQAIQAAPTNPPIQQALLALIQNEGSKIETAKKNIADWFNAGMDRVTGWYKRWSQIILVLVAFVVALTLGVDSKAIAKRLWSDAVMREAVVQSAEKFVQNNQANQSVQPTSANPQQKTDKDAKEQIQRIQAYQSQLEGLAIPMSPLLDFAKDYNLNNPGKPAEPIYMFGWWVGTHLLGFLLTSLAASLGAPFWFDILSKLINIRNTGRKPEEKQEQPAKS